MTTVYVVFYSMYGHVYEMAREIVAGAESVSGTQVHLFQIPELIPEDKLEASGAKAARDSFAYVPVIAPDDLPQADALILGTPTRFGNMCAQMRNFWDQTSRMWLQGALAGKVGSVFVSTATQHGGQETTITSFHTTLLHHGMIVVGVPYTEKALLEMSEISGGSPYGATTLADGDGSRWPSANERAIAQFQGRHVAQIAVRLFG